MLGLRPALLIDATAFLQNRSSGVTGDWHRQAGSLPEEPMLAHAPGGTHQAPLPGMVPQQQKPHSTLAAEAGRPSRAAAPVGIFSRLAIGWQNTGQGRLESTSRQPSQEVAPLLRAGGRSSSTGIPFRRAFATSRLSSD